MNHEEALADLVVPSKRDRYAELLRKPKHRDAKLLDRLNHNHDFDARYLLRVPKEHDDESGIARLLKVRGAPDECSVISANHRIDGKRMPLTEALAKTYCTGCGTVLSCIPGRLAYFEAEDAGERYLLIRQPMR